MAAPITDTKHFKISKLLGEKIRRMLPGEMIPTVMELKRQYKASQATITQAIDRLRAQGAIERPPGKKRLVVAKVGPRPRFQLTLIRPLWASPDYDSITNRIYEMGHDEHFAFRVYAYNEINDINIEHALGKTDAGLIIGAPNMNARLVDAINSSRRPIVFLRNKPEPSKAGSVWVDDIAVGKLATEHLIKLGHRRIAVMLSEPRNPSSSARFHGWEKTLLAAGVDDIDSLIADCSVQPGKESIAGSYDKFCRWLDSSPTRFTAVFCVAWTGALAVLRALRERNIDVPRDVSVITYASESPLCDFTSPPLTTVQIDLDEYTGLAIRLVTQSLAGEKIPPSEKDILLTPAVAVRGSTAKARSA